MPLAITAELRQQIRDLITRAEQYPSRSEAQLWATATNMTKADADRRIVQIPPYMVSYSLDLSHPGLLTRHLSISTARNPTARINIDHVRQIVREFGYNKPLESYHTFKINAFHVVEQLPRPNSS